MTEALTAVSRTAVATATVRAHETARQDRLFDDPYAAAFAAAFASSEPAAEPSPRQRALAFHVVIRTRFYDDWLRRCAADGIDQIVLVGAGLDTRAYRLPWPAGTTVVEVDLPAVLAAKAEVLEKSVALPTCQRESIGTDVRVPWVHRLRAAGIDPARPIAWLVEGLIAYLDAAESATLLAALTAASVAGSTIATESGERASSGAQAPVEALWRGGLDSAVGPWLAARGWDVDRTGLSDLAARYGRPIGESTSGFVTGVRHTAPGAPSASSVNRSDNA